MDKYREFRDNMLKRFGDPPSASGANIVAWILVLVPDPGADHPKAIELAEKAVALSPTNYDYINTLSAAYYRNKEYGKAVERLNEARERFLESEKKLLRGSLQNLNRPCVRPVSGVGA
jgi:tetratricopeptide (TPR) repeat protein